jgi:hypothetical protein
MITTRRTILSLAATLALSAALAVPAAAQAGKSLVDLNKAAEAELQQLPNVTPAIAKEIVGKRPFKTIVELNKLLVDQKLKPEQTKEIYAKAFVPINLNTGSREEFMLIPDLVSWMAAGFPEYRPRKTWTQFDKEVGKYVGQQETDRFKQYVFIPPG